MAHAPVDGYRANPFGLHDVHGNVWEWCQDVFDFTFYTWGPAVDPVNESTGPLGRVFRGGSAAYAAANARSANRAGDAPSISIGLLGVRPARAVAGEVRHSR